MPTMVPLERLSECDKELVYLANRLLEQFCIPIKVASVEDIGASVFVTLYEGLYGEQLPGIIREPFTREDEIHNCQTVIDSLSKDVLHISLSHIRGPEIISHSREDVSNLLEIFAGLSDYILTRIESDNEDTRSVENGLNVLNDPDLVTPEIIEDFLDRELSRTAQNGGYSVSPSTKKTAEYINSHIQTSGGKSPGLDSTSELIREGEKWEEKLRLNMQRISDNKSPDEFDHIGKRKISPEKSKTNGHQQTDSTKKNESRKTNLVQQPTGSDMDIHHTFTHHLYHYHKPQVADISNAVSNTVGAVGTSLATQYLDLDHHPSRLPTSKVKGPSSKLPSNTNKLPTKGRQIPRRHNDSSMSASLPMRLNPQTQVPDKLRSTIDTPNDYRQQLEDRQFRPVSRQSRESPVQPLPAKGLASSYDNLQNLVQSTATLARTAVKTSPIRSQADTSYFLTPPRSRPLRTKSPVLEDRNLASEINKTRTTRNLPDSNMSANSSNDSPGRVRRKVSFLGDRSPSTDSSGPSFNQRHSRNRGAPNVSLDMKRKEERLGTKHQAVRNGVKYGSYTDIGYLSDREMDSDTASDHYLQQRFNDIVDDVLSTDSDQVLMTKRRRKPTNNRQVRFEKILTKTGKGCLATARQQLRENKKVLRTSDILKKMYAEDYEDFVEETESDLKKTKDLVKEKEQEYKKKTAKKTRKPSVSVKSNKGPGAVKVPLTKPVSTKVRKCSSSSSSILPRKTMLTVHDEDELLPLLLEEFPHLHMSQHTWHELWRRGLTQIENITKAYEETKRRKSKSQVQVEEAVKRHEIVTRLERKQMDSMKRVREAKDQKKQQLQFKNKLHEKRQQSVRARKYYNEYAVRARSKLLRRRTKEEMIFKKLFKDGLAIQKERIQDIRKYSREQRDKQCRLRQDELDSMENYYHDQFEMLAAKVTTEREELLIREKAQQKALDQMKKELRKKMEKEIKVYQDQLFRDDDDAYFRQLDADRLRQTLHLAKYQTSFM
ncbi:uncharacterized protein LOC126810852 isoform X2 [Patella vulgata]|nr:uncharacterized protein LOC126810852 isoform X2 [Patella vulgata]XP_050392121.2 uncharacterized protein LOC126810852 isoform X2 [Patella vulgata]